MLYDIVTKSRELHRKLMIKVNFVSLEKINSPFSQKDRWKPSELELAILKLYFEKNQYPSTDEKQHLIEKLENSMGSKVNINQISRWFQVLINNFTFFLRQKIKVEREKKNNIGLKKNHKTIYKKFSQEELDFLKDSFAKVPETQR